MTEASAELKEAGLMTHSHPALVDSLSRTQRLRRLILDAPYEVCIERARYYTESWRRTEREHPCIRAALAFKHTLENMTVYILDDEAIAGNRSGKLVAAVIPIERGEINVVLEMELDRLTTRPDRPFHISSSERRELLHEILPYWRGRTIRDRKKQLWRENGLFFPLRFTPSTIIDRIRGFGLRDLYKMLSYSGGSIRLLLRAAEELPMNNPGMVMNVFDDQGHLILGHRNLIAEGFEGAKKRAEAGLKGVGEDKDAKAFLESVIICCDAARDFAARYASLAEGQAAKERDPDRRQELLAIAERCRHVPYKPPRDFPEALQWVWLTQVMAIISYGMGGIFALGRLDQYLYPYYKADIDAGRITEGDALALLEELIIKLSYNLLILPPYGKDTASELGGDNMAITIGGVGRDGQDAANPLSYLFLQAIENMRNMSNSVSFRISENSPQDYVEKAVKVYRHCNGPSIFNDEAIIPALVDCGYTIQDARDYALIGCVEPTSDGNTFGCTSGNDMSLVGALEMALHNGKLRIVGTRIGPETGDPREFQSFDEFLEAYKKQVSACIKIVADCTRLKDRTYAEMLPCPFVSTTLKGCIESAKDMTRGGAQYNFNSISARGLATAVDSLAAIRKFVFQDKIITMDELLKAIDNNFRNNETLRQRLKTQAPKFGNDIDEVDLLARDIAGFFCTQVMKQAPDRGGIFRPSFFSYGMHVLEGQVLGATPDGRKAGQAVSNSLSPANQSEQKGPVAVLQSVAKLNHRLIPNGSSTNLKFMPGMLATEEGINKIAAMIRAYFKLGGMQVQFNVVSDQVLRDAQEDPDSHKDLVVRVSGYSAYFVDLGKPIQDDIIARYSFDRF
jgi:pyruvate formate-lyase/glycerol dehydratase family glycyl radical enzyme